MRRMTNFSRVQDQASKCIAKLEEFSGVDKSMIENIMQYAKQLTREEHGEIDSFIFMSQMGKQFEIYSSTLLISMYESIKRPKASGLSVEDFCKCICVFLSDRTDIKAEFVFRVYDNNKDGVLSRYEVQQLLKTCIVNKDNNEQDMHDDVEEGVHELSEIVSKMLNIDNQGLIHMEQFRKMAKANSMYIELLGRCLPSEKSLQRFIARLSGKTPYEIRDEFKDEKLETLDGLRKGSVVAKKETTLYPINLDMP
ncbi:EF-hand calcium-binding domain-containing protein 1 [Biomphalaria pfeifferi]|uniref:EF-hand calcium-binding domain-containing protein 1 n=1 Tax=Biomphalaria pfeifferi TaxID=112525 RepID=A0AAD8BMI9_BIOPF|nr:EF-hand calcium-binding domain-containing protein 1 [Biomphalaria pfeifferi]